VKPTAPGKIAAVENQVNLMAPELTRLAQNRVALAYSLSQSALKTAAVKDRRKVVAALLTMPTFALQSLFDSHTAASHTADEPEDNPETPEDNPETPEGNPETPEDKQGTPEDKPEVKQEDDPETDPLTFFGGTEEEEDSLDPEDSAEKTQLEAENDALVKDIAKLESDFEALQEKLPKNETLDLSTLLSEDATDEKAAQLPGDQEGQEDPALIPAEEHTGAVNDELTESQSDEEHCQQALLETLKSDEADDLTDEPVAVVAEEATDDEGDLVGLAEVMMGKVEPAGELDEEPAGAKIAHKSMKEAGARFLPKGSMNTKTAAAASSESQDPQVMRIVNLLKQL
jgi:hypothetical protein